MCPLQRDIHYSISDWRPDAPPREQVVLEITPRMEGGPVPPVRVGPKGTLEANWLGHLVVHSWGWLLYDSHLAEESEIHRSRHAPINWRATAMAIPSKDKKLWKSKTSNSGFNFEVQQMNLFSAPDGARCFIVTNPPLILFAP
jgi:hypothetical protein